MARYLGLSLARTWLFYNYHTKDNDCPTLKKIPEHQLEVSEDFWQAITEPKVRYAILSHTWGPDEEEITFNEIRSGRFSRAKKGWFKIQQSRMQAAADGYDYVWIDTCCIDKSSSAELQEAINSMFYWYQRSAVCYVYLEDVNLDEEITNVIHRHEHCGHIKRSWDLSGDRYMHHHQDFTSEEVGWDQEQASAICDAHEFAGETPTEVRSRLLESRWFERGWTLQELLAPKKMFFFDSTWRTVGTKFSLLCLISKATGIKKHHLVAQGYQDASIAARMSWASRRRTSRIEDQAYSLLGIFGVNMPLLYGERHAAFIRLQEEIMKRSDDQSIFCWKAVDPDTYTGSALLAPSVQCFEDCSGIVHQESEPRLMSITNRGVSMEVILAPWTIEIFVAALNCQDELARPKCLFLRVVDDRPNNHYIRTAISGKPSPTDFDNYSSTWLAGTATRLHTVHVLNSYTRSENLDQRERVNGYQLQLESLFGRNCSDPSEHLIVGEWSKEWQAVHFTPSAEKCPFAIIRIDIAGCKVKCIALGFETTFDRYAVPKVMFTESSSGWLTDDNDNASHTWFTEARNFCDDFRTSEFEFDDSCITLKPFRHHLGKHGGVVMKSQPTLGSPFWWGRSDTRTIVLKGARQKGAPRTAFHVGLTDFGRGHAPLRELGGAYWRFATSEMPSRKPKRRKIDT